MKMLTKKMIWSMLLISGFIVLMSSCEKKEAAADKTCKIAFIMNGTNNARDTVFVNVMAGELIKDAPSISRAGFKFDGWYANSADANPDPTKNTAAPKFPEYDMATKPIYLDAILYARWIK